MATRHLQVHAQYGQEFARLLPDGTATFDWDAIRKIAAGVVAKKSTDPQTHVEDYEAIASLVWAAANPGVKP